MRSYLKTDRKSKFNNNSLYIIVSNQLIIWSPG